MRSKVRDDIEHYKQAIRVDHFFTREEEVELARRRDEGDMASRDALVKGCLPMALDMARIYSRPGNRSEFDDILGYANIGLVEAADAFDPARGRLSTVVSLHVKKRIFGYFYEGRSIVRIPRYAASIAEKNRRGRPLNEKQQRYLEQFGQNLTRPVQSIGFGRSDDGQAAIEDRRELETMETEEERQLVAAWIEDVIGRLPEREATILRRRFGIGCDRMTLAAIAHRHGVSRECIRLIEAKAISRINKFIPGNQYPLTDRDPPRATATR